MQTIKTYKNLKKKLNKAHTTTIESMIFQKSFDGKHHDAEMVSEKNIENIGINHFWSRKISNFSIQYSNLPLK